MNGVAREVSGPKVLKNTKGGKVDTAAKGVKQSLQVSRPCHPLVDGHLYVTIGQCSAQVFSFVLLTASISKTNKIKMSGGLVLLLFVFHRQELADERALNLTGQKSANECMEILKVT